MKRMWVVGVAAMMSLMIPLYGQEQDDVKRQLDQLRKEMQELKEQNKQLRSEIDEMKKDQSKPGEPEKKEPGLVEKILQEKKPPDQGKKQIESLYEEGFWFVGADDKLRIWGWTQEDFRAFDKGFPGDNTFLNRRTRITVLGTLENHFNYTITAALERSSDPVQFAWLEYAQIPWLKLRVGQFKEPFSMEELTSDLYLDLLERSIVTSNFSPAQDIGAMLYGSTWENRLEYAVGIFNGRGKTKEDNTDDKDVAARLTLAPFRTSETEALKGLYLGVNGTQGRMEETLAATSLKTAGQTKFWTYATGVTIDDDRTRLGADLEWLYGPAAIKAEWARSTFDNVRLSGVEQDGKFTGWYISGTYLLTGEKKPRGNKPVTPATNFDPFKGTWGAFELAARVEQFRADDDLLENGAATGTDEISAYTLGLNWTPNRHLRISFNYERSDFDDDVTVEGKLIDNEDLYLIRFQFEF